MLGESYSVEDLGLHIGLRPIEFRPPSDPGFFISRLPDEQSIVDSSMRVDLELIVSILTRDEKLHVVVLVDRIVLLGELGRHVGLLDSVANVQIFLIPKDRNVRLEMGRLATDKIDEAIRETNAGPTRLVELAIDTHRFADLLCLDFAYRRRFNRRESNGLLGQPTSSFKHQRQRDCDDPDRPKATNEHLHTIPINPWCIRQRGPRRLVAIVTYRS